MAQPIIRVSVYVTTEGTEDAGNLSTENGDGLEIVVSFDVDDHGLDSDDLARQAILLSGSGDGFG